MKISGKGLDLIKSFEGFSAVAYIDVAGRKTIGFGHLVKTGEVFGAVSSVEATALLARDVETAERCVGNLIKVPLTQNQFDALVSFVYNLGCSSLMGTKIRHYLDEEMFDKAAQEFLRWDHAGGVQVPGLTKRRNMEMELFLCQD